MRLSRFVNMKFLAPSVTGTAMGSLSNRLWTLFVLVLILQPAVAQFCTFWDSSCVDPLAQTAVPIDFRPLILQDISLYFAYDSSPNGKDGQPMTKSSVWLTYNNPRVDKTAITANRTSEVAMRVGNLTGTPGGSNNGCDNVWGTACSNTIKNTLKENMYELSIQGSYYPQPLETVVSELKVDQPSLGSCPQQFFDVSEIPVQGARHSFCFVFRCY